MTIVDFRGNTCCHVNLVTVAIVNCSRFRPHGLITFQLQIFKTINNFLFPTLVWLLPPIFGSYSPGGNFVNNSDYVLCILVIASY